MAEFFGVPAVTFDQWIARYPELKTSILNGRHIADAEVAHGLYHRAKGYSHPEEKVFNNKGEILTHMTMKHYPPDTAAAALWLATRDRNRWDNKNSNDSIDLSGEVYVKHVHELSDEQLEQIARRGLPPAERDAIEADVIEVDSDDAGDILT